MGNGMEVRPGIAYRRPDGDPDLLTVESTGRDTLAIADVLPNTECSRLAWLEDVHPDDRPELRSEIDDERIDVAYRIMLEDGTAWVHERGRWVDGDVVGYLFRADERIERERELEQQRERLEEFASVVSHDLRNPLSVAVGNLELAAELEGSAANERIERAQEALDRMNSLIGDLLALAREGRTVERTAPENLRTVVDRAWRTIDMDANATLHVDEPLPVVRCDERRLRQVFENLFRNAIEHATTIEPSDGAGDGSGSNGDSSVDGEPPAGSDSSASTAETESDAASVRIEVGPLADGFYVADDGPGIDPEKREAVFDPGTTTAPDGTGFGLAIVERIVEAHGWSIRITESRFGGARFEITQVECE